MNKTIKTAAIFGALAVAIGAFGAHGLKSFLIEAGRLDTFKTAVEYQFYHTLALLFIGVLQTQNDSKKLKWAAFAMTAGIIVFSGSLYVLCVSGLGILGAITPIGGLFFIAGWVLLILNAKK
ncbi:MAG TPA: DUF423 domain-containing protein [Fulvivirga sp.]|nr:DUF423 domain-containing protein [Fulvivirga sp.]